MLFLEQKEMSPPPPPHPLSPCRHQEFEVSYDSYSLKIN